MKEFFDHSFRYAVFFCSVFLLYSGATGFELPEGSSPLIHGLSIIVICVILGAIAAGIGRVFRRG